MNTNPKFVSSPNRWSLVVCAIGICLPWIGTVQADVVVLKSGGRIEGQVVTTAHPAYAEFYLVKTTSGVKLTVDRSQVERVERKSPALQEYEVRLPKVGDTIEKHLDIADWCFKNKLHRQRAFHLEQILRHDPDHKVARYGLGYSRVEGRWVKTDEWNRKQGYFRTLAGWRTRQEIMLAEAKEEYEKAEKKWRSDIKMWRGWYDSRRRKDAALDNFREIQNPLASMGVAELLKKEKDHFLKIEFIKILGRLNTPKAQTALMELAIEDESSSIREKCLDQLVANKSRLAVYFFKSQLNPVTNKDNTKINRAGTALGRLKDPSSVMAMIDALETEHRTQSGNSGGLSTTFSNLGANGLSTGGSKTIVNHVRNESVLNGLQAITGVRLGWDKEEWRKWYVKEHTPQNVQLRRRP